MTFAESPCSRCGHPASYHTTTRCMVEAGGPYKAICDCGGWMLRTPKFVILAPGARQDVGQAIQAAWAEWLDDPDPRKPMLVGGLPVTIVDISTGQSWASPEPPAREESTSALRARLAYLVRKEIKPSDGNDYRAGVNMGLALALGFIEEPDGD